MTLIRYEKFELRFLDLFTDLVGVSDEERSVE